MALKIPKPKLTAVGPYQILGLIGEGAMGAVYKARHQDGGEEIAIKVLPPDLAANPVRLKRFEQEFRAAKALSHPNVVNAIDFGNHEGTPYFVMEFVEGQSLAARIGRDGKIPEAEAVALVVQVAEALHQAHSQGIIHRDVKPDNVLLTPDGRAKLADLGLAKDQAADLDLTRPNSGLGTPNYMAPEQFRNAKNADPRCDVYSLGATLYVALTAELPFRGRTPLHTLKKKTKNELTPPRKLVPNLSERVERAMLKAMCVEPRQRYPTCLAFAADLQGKEVDDADLAISPSQQARPRVAIPLATKSKGAERRATVRYATNHDGFAKPLACDAQSHWSAKVIDLSEGGIKLVLPRRFEPKAVLIVELPGEGEAKPRKMLVRVVRVRKQGAGQWAMGCKFARSLSAEERDLLV